MKILCFGSLNIDHVYQVPHIVLPGETLPAAALQDHPGGKGLNQSIALARAGAAVYHAGRVGADGGMLTDILAQSGVDTRFVSECPAPTGHAIIQVDQNGQNSIVIYGGANAAVAPEDIDRVLQSFAPGDLLLLQNEISNVRYAIRAGHERGLTIALNPSPIDAALASAPELALVDILLLNELEGAEITGETEPEAICTALQAKYPGCQVVLTLGKQGCIYHSGTQRCAHGIYDVPVVDTTGAGDTFTGYFLACTLEGMAPQQALELASRASSLAVSRAGAAPSIPWRAEVDAADMTPL